MNSASVMLKETLKEHPFRAQLLQHPFFGYIEKAHVTRELAARFIGQWWHPLHYFPTFLSRTIAIGTSLATKTATSHILFQELGEGDVTQAHEAIYIKTMRDAGFALEQITGAEPSPATAALVAGYEEASGNELTGAGFLYATEVADLKMVSGIGMAVRRAVGVTRLPWVDIHVRQEPAHVREADIAVSPELGAVQTLEVLQTAEKAWSLWVGFFDHLHEARHQ